MADRPDPADLFDGLTDEERATLIALAETDPWYNPEQRFKAYRRDPDRDRNPVEVVAAATPEALGLALVTIGREHVAQLREAHPPVGILDTLDRKWLVSLWEAR